VAKNCRKFTYYREVAILLENAASLSVANKESDRTRSFFYLKINHIKFFYPRKIKFDTDYHQTDSWWHTTNCESVSFIGRMQ
jgi:hypothetical protein